MKAVGCTLAAADVEKVKMLCLFDESDPIQHMVKVMFGCGLYAGFRGNMEHTNFNISMVHLGNYPAQYEDKDLAGLPYVAISNFQDKTNKLSVNNSYLRDTSNILRFPVIHGDDNDFGGALFRLYEKLSPGQTRMYCQPASSSYIQSLRRAGHLKAVFYHNKPLGTKTIAKLFKTGADILGLPKTFRAHSLRSANITMLANNPSVSLKETMAAARHNSVSASMVYQRSDGISEGNRLRALGVNIPSKKDVEVKKLPALPEATAAGALLNLKSDLQAESVAVEGADSVGKKSASESSWSLVDIDGKKLESDDDSSFEDIVLHGRAGGSKKSSAGEDDSSWTTTGEAEEPSMTQFCIEQLKDDLAELKILMENEDKPPPKSENQVIIEGLRAEVQTLKRKLGNREKDRLYHESMNMAAEKELDEVVKKYKRECIRREALERENREYELFCQTRFPKSGPKKHDYKDFYRRF